MRKIKWILSGKIQKDMDKLEKSRKYVYDKLMKIMSEVYYEDLKKLYKFKILQGCSDSGNKLGSVRLTRKDRLVFEELDDGNVVKITLEVIQVDGHYDDH